MKTRKKTLSEKKQVWIFFLCIVSLTQSWINFYTKSNSIIYRILHKFIEYISLFGKIILVQRCKATEN